jgi:transketolase
MDLILWRHADAEPGEPDIDRPLTAKGVRSRVVSMASWDIFEHQPQSYREEVLPPGVKARVSVEMGSVIGWDRYVGATGAKIGMHTFGSSAPLKDLLRKFGFLPEQVLAAAREQLAAARMEAT